MNEERVNEMMEAVKGWVQACHSQGLPDLRPQLAFLPNGEEQYIVVPDWVVDAALVEVGGEVADGMELILSGIPAQAPEAGLTFNGFKSVTIVADGYMLLAEGDEGNAIETEDNGLQRDFETNPASKVSEAISILMADDDLVGGVELTLVQLPYFKTDGGLLHFRPPTVHTDDGHVQGRFPDMMRRVWANAQS